MPQINILLNGAASIKASDLARVIEVHSPLTVAALPAGMQSGAASVSFTFELPDGKVIFFETSLALFQLAAKMFAARYGWQHEKAPQACRN